MPATFKPELKSAPRQDKTYAIRIRITKFRQHAYLNLGKYVQKTQWNPKPKRDLKNWVVKNEEAPQINNAIANALKGLEKASDANPAATAVGIKEAYERVLNPEAEEQESKPVSFFQYAEEYLGRKASINYTSVYGDQYYVAEYKAVIGEHLPLPELFNARNALKFLKHLKDKGNGPVTIKNKFSKIGAIYRAGVKEKILPNIGDVFTDINLVVPKKKKPRPQAEQVKKFLAYQPQNKLQAMAKNVTMLQYLLQGSRIMEALTLEWADVHESYAEYLPQKNALKPKFIPRSPLLNKLLEEQPKEGRYVLPYIGEDFETLTLKQKHNRRNRITREVNTGLKEIAEALGIDVKLSSHMFRHAFADALRESGISIYAAGALLGHSNYRTTENYFQDLGLEETSKLALSIFRKLETNEENSEGNTGEQ
jgi:site-specific recombinase XerD